MSVTKCLKCEEPVLVPGGASLKATVRCPLCHEQFELGEMLDEVPPPLEIVEDPDAVAVGDVQPFNFDLEGNKETESAGVEAGEQVEGEAAEAVKAEAEPSDESEHAGVAAFQFDASPQDGDAGATGTRSAHPAARPKPKGKNPVVEIAKIVGGGLLGIALAVVGIWWIAQKDPFKLGPKVSGVVPWIVPEKFHGPGNNEEDETESDGKNDGKNKNRRPQGVDLPQSSREQNEHIAQQDLADSPFNELGKAPKENSNPTPSARTNESGNSNGKTEPNVGPVDRLAPDFLGIRNVETPTPDELKEAVGSAEVALTIWDSDLESEEYRQRALEKLSDLGKTIACVNQTLGVNEDLARKAEKDVLEFLAESQTKLDAVNGWAAQKIKSGNSDVQGVVLAAEILSIEAMGQLFVNRMELLTEDREEVSMITARDLSEQAPPGAKVIVGGALVGDPSVNFGGYTGNDQMVIGCGTFIVLPDAPSGTDN